MPLPGLLARLTVDPGRPRLTWYAPAERVELSGHVLDNWVTKTANLLVEEYDAGPGSRILLDLPVHWRTVVWAIAAWRVGASVVLPPSTGRLNLVVTDRPSEHSGVDVVAVALPALARSFEGELPVGAVDSTGAVMTYGDVLTWMPEPDPIGPALEHGGPNVRHDHLVRWGTEVLTRHGGARPGGRVLVETGDDRGPLADVLGIMLAVYATDGSIVLRHDAADVSTARLVETELITDQVDLG
jgi:uncharacterized protein (TIGR03089 family)